MLMYLIGVAFSVVSPLVAPFSVVWFTFAWLAWRHNLCYVYQRKYESGEMRVNARAGDRALGAGARLGVGRGRLPGLGLARAGRGHTSASAAAERKPPCTPPSPSVARVGL